MTEDMPSVPSGGSPPVTFKLHWPEAAAAEAVVATQFGIVGDGHPSGMGLYLLVGQVIAPAWFTDQEKEVGYAASSGELNVKLKGSFYMTRANALELLELLRQNLEGNDE